MGFKVLSKNDLTKTEKLGVKVTEEEDYRLPTGEDYELESLEEIESYYEDKFPTKARARIYAMTGHMRYLRALLDEHGIPYSKTEKDVKDPFAAKVKSMNLENFEAESDRKFKESLGWKGPNNADKP